MAAAAGVQGVSSGAFLSLSDCATTLFCARFVRAYACVAVLACTLLCGVCVCVCATVSRTLFVAWSHCRAYPCVRIEMTKWRNDSVNDWSKRDARVPKALPSRFNGSSNAHYTHTNTDHEQLNILYNFIRFLIYFLILYIFFWVGQTHSFTCGNLITLGSTDANYARIADFLFSHDVNKNGIVRKLMFPLVMIWGRRRGATCLRYSLFIEALRIEASTREPHEYMTAAGQKRLRCQLNARRRELVCLNQHYWEPLRSSNYCITHKLLNHTQCRELLSIHRNGLSVCRVRAFLFNDAMLSYSSCRWGHRTWYI